MGLPNRLALKEEESDLFSVKPPAVLWLRDQVSDGFAGARGAIGPGASSFFKGSAQELLGKHEGLLQPGRAAVRSAHTAWGHLAAIAMQCVSEMGVRCGYRNYAKASGCG